jgi:hypothetical protein
LAIYVNGVDGATGRYLTPLTPERAAQLAHQERLPPGEVDDLRLWLDSPRFRGLAEGDADDLAQAGWGVIFAEREQNLPALRKALEPLLTLRREQASAGKECYYWEFWGACGYRAGESKTQFLTRHGAGPGPADPRRVPYYLLIVGDPAAVPYGFQYQLDVEYAVGRLHFETLEEYARYAEAVVAEGRAPERAKRRLVLFGTCHDGDDCTSLSSQCLVAPLADHLRGRLSWDIDSIPPMEATKARLSQLLGGADRPDLLFTATHGVLYGADDPRQVERQGALVCQDWPGPEAGEIEEEHCFAAEDVGDDARVGGLVTFQFGCFTAGSPDLEDLGDPLTGSRIELAQRPFLAKLPQRLLAHPGGGALAFIGHVERALPSSIEWNESRRIREIRVFQQALREIVAGRPVGMAMESFGKRYAGLACDLEAAISGRIFGDPVDEIEVGHLWAASRDVRNYVVLGDPAVRLTPPVVPPEEPRYRDGGAFFGTPP